MREHRYTRERRLTSKQNDEIKAQTETSSAYPVRDITTITMNEMARSADGSVYRILVDSLTSRLVERFRRSTLQIFVAFLRAVVAKCGGSVLDTELRLSESIYMMVGYTPTIIDVQLVKCFIAEPIDYVRRLQRLFVNNQLGSSRKDKNSFVLLNSGEKKGGGLWVAEIQLLLIISVRGGSRI